MALLIMRFFQLLLLFVTLHLTTSSGDDKLCHVCRSTAIEVDKALTKTGSKRGESDIMDVLSDICKFESFKVYDFPPPKMVSMCKQVMDSHDEQFELAFQDRSLKVEGLQEKICASFCEGIDVTKERVPEKPQVFMDGEPVETAGGAPPTSSGQTKKKTKKKKKKKKMKKKKKKKKKNKKKQKTDEL